MQRLINQIYWSSRSFFTNGTKLKMTKNLRVRLQNPLMVPGRSAVHWDSSLNYQGDKEVPPLPILKVGQEYRLVAHLSTTPADSYIIRLTFRDIQGTEIKRFDFRSLQRNFIFPNDAVTYSIDIINSGFYELQFDRLEIGPTTLPGSAYGDIWVQKQINMVSDDYALNIILIDDGKQSRRTHPELTDFYTRLPIQPISISWQYDGDLEKWLAKWLNDKQIGHCHLISTSSRFDRMAAEFATKYPLVDAMLSQNVDGDFADYHVWKHVDNGWSNPNITDVNLQGIVYDMKNTWEGGKS